MEKREYLEPRIEVLEIAVENGFAQSGGEYPGWGQEYPLG